jgi:hypothetical protein
MAAKIAPWWAFQHLPRSDSPGELEYARGMPRRDFVGCGRHANYEKSLGQWIVI